MTLHAPATAPRPEQSVTARELVFDLVFVFAVMQLSHHLLEHLSWRGAAETLVLLLAVFAVWYYTSWEAIVVQATHRRTLMMILTVILLGLFMNASLTRAFEASSWAFVIPFLLIQLGRTTWTLMNAPDAAYREHYRRTLIWLVATTPLWLAGAATDPNLRLWWWGLAAGLDLIGTWLAHPVPGRRLHSEHMVFEGDHMLERCRLFLIIALGETVLGTGTALAGTTLTPVVVITGTAALIGTVALWTLGFGRAVHLTERHLARSANPVRTSRLAGNALTVMVAGLIVVAVANEQVIAHPTGHPSLTLTLLLFGGPILFLLAQGWYLWAVPGVWSRLHLAGSVLLMLAGVITLTAPPYVALILAGATLAAVALLDPGSG